MIDRNTKLNVITSTNSPTLCRSELLGQPFDFEIYLTEDGELELLVDGKHRMDDIIELIAAKCKVPPVTILPLLITNVALLYQGNAKQQSATPKVGRQTQEDSPSTLH